MDEGFGLSPREDWSPSIFRIYRKHQAMAESLFNGEGAQAEPIGEAPATGTNGEVGLPLEAGEGPRGEGEARDGEVAEAVEEGGNSHSKAAVMEPPREEIERELESLSRGPFRRILKDFIGFTPSADALKNFANKHPDKWVNSLGVLAQLGGYVKDVTEVNNIVVIGHMDDSALIRRMQELEKKLGTTANLIGNSPSPMLRDIRVHNPSTDDNIIDVKATEKPSEDQ